MSPLQTVRARFDELRLAYRENRPTRDMLVALAALDLALVELECASERALSTTAQLYRAEPIPAATVAALYDAPEVLRCPRCLARADRGHIEQHGTCYDCALARPASQLSAPAGASIQSDAPPPASTQTPAGAEGVPQEGP